MGYQANKIWFSLDFEGFNAEVKLYSIKLTTSRKIEWYQNSTIFTFF